MLKVNKNIKYIKVSESTLYYTPKVKQILKYKTNKSIKDEKKQPAVKKEKGNDLSKSGILFAIAEEEEEEKEDTKKNKNNDKKKSG